MYLNAFTNHRFVAKEAYPLRSV